MAPIADVFHCVALANAKVIHLCNCVEEAGVIMGLTQTPSLDASALKKGGIENPTGLQPWAELLEAMFNGCGWKMGEK